MTSQEEINAAIILWALGILLASGTAALVFQWVRDRKKVFQQVKDIK